MGIAMVVKHPNILARAVVMFLKRIAEHEFNKLSGG